ncbi:MAG: hypothetical protein DBX59_00610 [Bacillota bacterium]|nr:MAG: hypothetical protein DBX59_00610 [Bacillota bacterium]
MDNFIEAVNNAIGNPALTAMLVSLIPLIELKGAILFARASGLSFLAALGSSYLGSTLVFIPIFFLLRPILNLLKKIKWFNSFAEKVETYFQKKADDVKKRKGKLSESGIKMLGVFIFIAIPLPMTGVWTGTAVAVFLGLKFRQVILPVLAGNLVAGLIISLLAELFLPYVDYILYGLFGLVIVMLIVFIVKVALTKPKKAETAEKGEITEEKKENDGSSEE